MIGFSIFGIAVNAIRANKLRSSLTLLGIVFGMVSIMTIISALEGMTNSIKAEIGRLGPSTFMVAKMMITTSREDYFKKIKRKSIDLKSADLITNECNLCEKVSPRTFAQARIKYGSEYIRDGRIMAGTYNLIDIIDIEVAQGRFHSMEDDLHRSQVVLIGDGVKEKLFSGIDPIGKTLRVGSKKYTIIGIAKKLGPMFGQERDNFVVMPLSTYGAHFGQTRRGLNIVIKALSVEKLEDAMDEVRLLLRSQRGVAYDEEDDFDMMTADIFLELLNSITRVFRIALIGVSSISIVVGGIVVMNVMMVAVSERTREIGIRKAIGAKRRHILLQFLFESLILTSSGGLVGMVIGHLLAKFLVGMIDMNISPSALAIIAGLSISMGTGLVFGIYPALKAAKLDPIKALSFE
ncbi:MAG: ABC transporter permease [candidate division Zixibacteria bacterium]|nr:ABC transporter permease [candidate division Zixibacteria bacterium]